MVGREDVGHELLAPDQPDETGHGAYSIERKDGDLGDKHRPVIEADLVVHNIGQLVTCEPALGEGTLGVLENAAVAAKDGNVVWVGPTGRWQWRPGGAPDAVVVDAGGGWGLAGFVGFPPPPPLAGQPPRGHPARLRRPAPWGGG